MPPEPLTAAYLKEIQDRVTDAPKGPWDVEPNEFGAPDQVGPIAYLQTWADVDLAPTVTFISHARRDVPALLGEVSRQQDAIRAQELRIRQLEQARDGGPRDR
ncbi:hypothetical protein ACIP4X_17640 [Streptomyces sp. NPDC088817]|uniref:hypothetical protein n=1 Tax=Streptomyces sp. NPDC088817 TaxID=3365907 RepID=UPI0038003EE8